MEARAKIEEDLFTRVPLSKTERRRAKATTRSMNSLANVGDFGDDVADLVEVAEELEAQGASKRKARLVDSVSLASGMEARQKSKPASGEQDVPLRDSLGVSTDYLRFLFQPFPGVFISVCLYSLPICIPLLSFAPFEASTTQSVVARRQKWCHTEHTAALVGSEANRDCRGFCTCRCRTRQTFKALSKHVSLTLTFASTLTFQL